MGTRETKISRGLWPVEPFYVTYGSESCIVWSPSKGAVVTFVRRTLGFKDPCVCPLEPSHAHEAEAQGVECYRPTP